MKQENQKIISIRLIYVILFFVGIIVATIVGIKFYKIHKNNTILENHIGMVEQEEVQVSSRTQQNRTSSRSETLTRSQEASSQNQENEIEKDSTDDTTAVTENENEQEKVNSKNNAEPEEQTNYISISEVKISQNMDLTVRTGLSREDFITLIAGVKQDTSGFFEENAGKIYDLCEEYSLNEIFFCGIVSAESGWNIAQNHRRTHNYISLMSNGKLISYASVDSGLREAARVLHTNYLTKGGKYYYGKTLSAVKTKFCPSSSTWVSLVYGRMGQIVK